MKRAYAHSLDSRPKSEWEPLETHLIEVAEMAEAFCKPFGFSQHAYLTGLWHDLGKYSAEFQAMIGASEEASLETLPGRVDHSTFGAQHASKQLGHFGWLIAYCIAGHHAGLADAFKNGATRSLDTRLKLQDIPAVPASDPSLAPPPQILHPPQSNEEALRRELRKFAETSDSKARSFRLAFACRMVFSALVDADSLCTRRFYASTAPDEPEPQHPSFPNLAATLSRYLDGLEPVSSAVVASSREAVRSACRTAARGQPGFYSLSVPTGGGKTLSSLQFALDHIVEHDLRRVVYVAPFTTIIEQNATAIRKALGDIGTNVVLEHHSAVDSESESRWLQLATENWDAPIVVTTNVQFFESLYSRSRNQCRKLHRLAKSVIILDEAQAIPTSLLSPCLAALRELVQSYGCTVVLCTATQPAFTKRASFPIGLDPVHEIVPNVPELFSALERTRFEFVGHRTNDELSEVLRKEAAVLCIVNTRRHAHELYRCISGATDGVFHLSAAMCPAHRTETLERIRSRLANGISCRVISTQVVEAGVDIDFPVVYRAMAGLDSLAQAAGRCNRNGLGDVRGRVIVFETDYQPTPQVQGARTDAREVILSHGKDILRPPAIQAYFQLHYWKRSANWDTPNVMDCFFPGMVSFGADFSSAAEKFHLIDQGQIPIMVEYNDQATGLIRELQTSSKPGRHLLRAMQRFAINVYTNQFEELKSLGLILSAHDGVWFLPRASGAYKDDMGLVLGDQGPLIV